MLHKFSFNFETIFYRYLKRVSFKKALKLIDNPKYVVVEFITSKKDNPNHFPNAIQINILQYEDVLKLVNPSQIILINNPEFTARQYYRFLKENDFKVYIIKQ